MASIINASTSGVGGVITTADNSGDLNIQSGGSTKIAVTSSGVAVTGLAKASLPTGSVLQVVNATYATETTNSTTTFADTGLTAAITPISSSSKILVLVSMCGVGVSAGASNGGRFQLVRNSTTICNIERMAGYTGTALVNYIGSVSTNYLDSPNTTSSTTYKVQFSNRAAAATVIICTSDGGTASTSTLTLMEIAA